MINLCCRKSEAHTILRSKAAHSDVEGCAGEQSFSAAADTGQIGVFAVTEVHAFLHQIVMKVGGETFILIIGLSPEGCRREARGGQDEKQNADRSQPHRFEPHGLTRFVLDFGSP